MPEKLKFCAISAILVLSLPVFAQKSGVSGHIQSTDGRSVFNSSVLLEGTSYGVTSDSTGYYHIANVDPGQYTLVISHVNFETERVSIDLRNEKKLTINKQLNEKVSALTEIEVIGKTESQEIREKPFHVNVIDIQPLEQKNLDITKVLTQASGIRLRQEAGLGSSFDLTLNGINAAQLIDGIPVDVYGSAYAFNSVPLNQVERIEIFKGVVPVHLGSDALGGAVNIVSKNKITNNLATSYSIGSFNTHKANVTGAFHNVKTGFTVTGSAFFNYSDNSYTMKNMIITDTTTTPDRAYQKDVKRFHDDFLSYAARAEAGVSNKKFADLLLAGFGFSGIRREIQTGGTQYPVAGEVTGEEDNYHFSVRYRKQALLNNKLDLEGFILYNTINTLRVDTSSRQYQWDGTVLKVRTSKKSGELGDKEIYSTTQRDLSQRYSILYHLTTDQTITLNVISSTTSMNYSDPNKLEGTLANSNNADYNKLIIGLGHDMSLWNEKLRTTAFVKYYRMMASIDSTLRWRGGYYDLAAMESTRSFTGAGLGISYVFSDWILVKASSEYACRLPTTAELLGDGISTAPNVGLRPEVSMNYNLGFSSNMIRRPTLKLTFEGTGFYREAQDFIRQTAAAKPTSINYQNVRVAGVEAEIKLIVEKKLSLRANATYQQVMDANKYLAGAKNYTYGVQLPNTPYLFGNFDAEYKIGDLFHNKLNLIPYYSLLYVNEFYLGYANIAQGDRKYTIPTQLIHDVGVTLSESSDKYSVSLACTNFTDAMAYDSFRLQKPGRAFSLKITYTLE